MALPVSQPEGRIARRGAVRAALKARDYVRAHTLAELYSADEEASESLRTALLDMLEEDARALERLLWLRPAEPASEGA